MANLDNNGDIKANRKTSEWKRCSTTEKLLFLIATFGFILCVTFLGCLTVMVINYKNCAKNSTDKHNRFTNHNSRIISKSCNEICLTATCRNEASVILKTIDETVDPCDDFYQFACGNFIKNSVIPVDDNKIDFSSIMQNQITTEIMNEVQGDIKPDDLEAFKKIKIYYKNCMNKTPTQANKELNILLETINHAGGWPALLGDKWRESSFDWIDAVYKTKDFGYPVMFPMTIGIEIDPKNTTRNIIGLLHAVTRVRQAFVSEGRNGTIMTAYYNYMVDTAVMLGADREVAARDMEGALEFELQLYVIQSAQDSKNESSEPITIAELSRRHPSIPWLQIINETFRQSGAAMSESELVWLNDPKYFERLEALVAASPRRVLGNYLMWQVVYDSIDYLADAFLERKLAFSRILDGVEKRKERPEVCVGDVINAFPIAVGALYVRRHFHREARDAVMELVKNIKDQFRQMLVEVDWMDEETRSVALEKIDAMSVFVGCSDELFDDRKIDEYYGSLDIRPGSYLKSAFNVSLFFSRRFYGTLRQPVDKQDWTMRQNAAIVNAYYYIYTNTFEIPAGCLRGSFFHFERPQYMNYGAIGSIIGHEITHGFDSDGRKNDKNGNEVDWWQPGTKTMYMEKTKCMIDQYNDYTIKEVEAKINGERTQSENIADNGGLRAAYRAYDHWSKNASEPCLPGLGYTPRQLFWISTASNWCQKQKLEMLRDLLNRDQHSPSEARVILPLSNIKEFARDFGCAVGSRMNPADKCVVW